MSPNGMSHPVKKRIEKRNIYCRGNQLSNERIIHMRKDITDMI